MKTLSSLLFTSFFLLNSSCEHLDTKQMSEMANQVISGGSVLTNQEISTAFKQLLTQGITKGAQELSVTNGFLNNPNLAIPFPPEAQKLETTLRKIGFNSVCDKFYTSMNRGAESAVISAIPIFTEAISNISFSDVTNLLKGDSNAITLFLKEKTSIQLIQKFKPSINSELKKVSATQYWSDLTSKYNKIPLVRPVQTDLSQYVAERAVQGLFTQIAKEELNIRENPAARTTNLLKKVFSR